MSERKSRRVENYTVKLVLIDLTFILRMKLAYQFLSRFTFLVFVSLVVRGSSKKKEKETRRNDSLDSNQNRIWNNTTANILSKYSLSDKILIRSIVSIDRSTIDWQISVKEFRKNRENHYFQRINSRRGS